MPNWVINKVQFDDKRVIKDCVQKDTKGEYFNFNRVVKMPEEIKDTQAPNHDEAKAKELIKKYGAPDWYEWSCANWGTKWNANDTVTIDENEVEFQTAWSTPVPIFLAISKKYETRVIVEYADEDIGSNCGKFVVENGKIVKQYVGDANFADWVWGYADGYDEDALAEVEP